MSDYCVGVIAPSSYAALRNDPDNHWAISSAVAHPERMLKVIFSAWAIQHLGYLYAKSPLTSTWPHLRCEVGLKDGEY